VKNLNKREKILVVLLAVAVISYAYFSYFLAPILDKANVSKGNITTYKSQLEEIRNTIANNSKYQEDYNTAIAKFNTYSVKMPYSVRGPEIVYNLKAIADKAESTINSISLSEVENTQQGQAMVDSSIVVVPVTILYNSVNYTKAMNFIDQLEKNDRIVQISSLSISKGASTATSTSTSVQTSVVANYYYLKSQNPSVLNYKFNNGVYGKANLFN
jgi:type IV pilus assembly protein PilO